MQAFYLIDGAIRPTMTIPSLLASVSAGQPITIFDEVEEMDLNYLLTKGVEKPMLVRIDGDSMCPEISSGDWVMLAVGKEPKPNDIIVGHLNGGYTVKRFKHGHKGRRGLFLVPTNGELPEREIKDDDDYDVVGVVMHIIHAV
jgi:SOS-response transcriptional repressor LexA